MAKKAAAKAKPRQRQSQAAPKPALSHLDSRGQAHMVDVSAKRQTERVAKAEGKVIMRKETLDLVIEGNALKGDVLGAARLAGIMAAKHTHGLIPLCHPLPITKVEIDIFPEHSLPGFLVQTHRQGHRPDRRRDGSVGRGLDRVPDDLRHGQGGRARHAHRRHPRSGKERRQVRHLQSGRRMIPKSGNRFSDKIMRKRKCNDGPDAGRRSVAARAGRCARAAGRGCAAASRARPRAGQGLSPLAHPAAGRAVRHGRLRGARR